MAQPGIDDVFFQRGLLAREAGMTFTAAHRMLDEYIAAKRITSDQHDSFWAGWRSKDQKQYLVDFLATAACSDKSIVRRYIVEGRVKVNDIVVDDVAATLSTKPGDTSKVEFKNDIYTFQP